MIRILVPLLLVTQPAWAETPDVVTDITPIQSLAARVMEGVGTPDVLLPAGTDVHHHSLTISNANALTGAELVIWVGPQLTPWLSEPIATLVTNATQIALTETSDWGSLELRHEHGDKAHEEDEHAEHADEEHETEEHHEDKHEDDTHGNDTREGTAIDPHGWLNPQIASIWMDQIADALAQQDPVNADIYLANAAAGKSEMMLLSKEITAMLTELNERKFILPHDGYQYFEQRFGLEPEAFITDSDAHEPGPAHIAELRDIMLNEDVACVFTDREVNPSWATVLLEGTDAKTTFLDTSIDEDSPISQAYAVMIRRIAVNFAACLS